MLVWIVNAFDFIPSDEHRPTRLMGIADALCGRGHEVVVWTGSFRHGDKKQRVAADESLNAPSGYDVRVLRSWSYRRNISLKRFAAHQHLAVRLGLAMSREPARPDLILCATPPLGTATAVHAFAARHGIPVVVDVIDPWPDVFLERMPAGLRWVGKFGLWPLEKQARSMCERAAAVTAIGRKYESWALRMSGRSDLPTRVFHPGVDLTAFDAAVEAQGGYRRDPLRDRRIRFVYAGMLGASYDVKTIVGCARQLARDGFEGAEFLIAGDGPNKNALMEEAARSNLAQVRFLGWLGKEELVRLYASSHVGVACYAIGATQSVTYKLFDYLQAGLPILSSLPGEMAALISNNDVGFHYEPENTDALMARVKQLCEDRNLLLRLSHNARRFCEEAGDNRRIYADTAAFLEEQALEGR